MIFNLNRPSTDEYKYNIYKLFYYNHITDMYYESFDI